MSNDYGVSWVVLYQDLKDLYREDLDETEMLRATNRTLDSLKFFLHLPTQIRLAIINYLFSFEKYLLPTDFKSEGLIDLRYNDIDDNARNRTFIIDEPPFLKHNSSWSFFNPKEWNPRTMIDQATIQWDKGIQSLQLANGRASQIKQEINNCDSLDGWTGASGAGNLTLDTVTKTEGEASINFDLTSATASTLTLVLPTSIDLSDYVNEGIIRLHLWLPTAPTSIDIEIGTGSSAKHAVSTIKTQPDGASFDTSRINEVEMKFKDATLTGTPDMAAVTHFKITFNFAASTTDTDYRIDNINAFLPENLDLEFYSFHMVQDANGDWQEKLTESLGQDETVNILTEWRALFAKKVLLENSLNDEDTRFVTWTNETDRWMREVRNKFPTRAKRVGNSWFN